MSLSPRIIVSSLLLLGAAVSACSNKETKDLAPASDQLQGSTPASEQTLKLSILQQKSQVGFQMDAELEKITGKAPNSASGTLNIEPHHLEKSSGIAQIDLLQLSLYQRKRSEKGASFGKEIKSEKQNQHMRVWLQISDDGPKEQVAANRYAEFKINGLKNLSATDITKLKGTTRTITATAFGDVRVHGRISEVSLPIELSFKFQEEQLKTVSILGKDTLDISLEKHDVRPRSAFNILADKTLDALGQKVAKVAKISLHIFAQAES